MNKAATDHACVIDISVLGTRGFPNIIGGVETHCALLYPALAAQEHDFRITVYARTRYLAAPIPAAEGRLTVKRLWSPARPGLESALHTIYGLLHATVTRGAHLVHIHGIGPAGIVPLARALGHRVVVTHHSRNYLDAKWGFLARAFFRLGEWIAAHLAHGVVIVSETLMHDFLARHPGAADRTSLIRHGYPDAAQPEPDVALLAGFGLEPGGYCVTVGRLDATKRIEDIIAAYRMAGSAAPPRLVIVGDSLGDSRYADMLRRADDPRVMFTGAQTGEELRALVAHAAVSIHASEREGFGLALLEAAVSGAPLLASDIPAFREIGLPADRYFTVGDVDQLARRLAAGDYRAESGDAVAGLRARYSLSRMVSEHARLFRGLAHRRRR